MLLFCRYQITASAGLVYWQFLKTDGTLHSRLCGLIDKLRGISECAGDLEAVAKLWTCLSSHCEPWVESLQKACQRLASGLEAAVFKELKACYVENGFKGALEWLKPFEALPGNLQQGKAVLQQHEHLEKLADSTPPTDIAELAKQIGSITSIAAFDQAMLSNLLPEGCVEQLNRYLHESCLALEDAINTWDVKFADLLALFNKYRQACKLFTLILHMLCFDTSH